MKFTNNIVCNNCTGARIYQQLGLEYNNPFMWSIIEPNDMYTLIKEWDNLNFNNYKTIQGEIYSGQEYVKRYYTLIDDKVKVWWVHYIQDDLYDTPTKLTHILHRNSDIHYNKIVDFINEKYERRIKRLSNEMPTFLIVGDNGWGCDYDNFKIDTKYNTIFVSDKYNLLNDNTLYIPLLNENYIDVASRISHYWKDYKQSVLTYIIGNYEQVHEIRQKDDDTEYILVTDNPNLNSTTWNIYYDKSLSGSTFDRCYEIRFNPFKYVHTDVVLRIDGSIEIKKSLKDLFDKFNDGDYDISLMIHPYRNTMSAEYDEWVKGRNYPQSQADKCLKYIHDELGLADDYKGLYQMCYEIQRNNDYNNRLNRETLDTLKKLGDNGVIERLDQTIFSAILNAHYQSDKIMWVSQMLITDNDYMLWTYHNSNVKLPTHYEIDTYAFNKPCNITNVCRKQPKLLILSMSCQKQDFIDEENMIRDTWAKPILEGKYPNIEWYAYRGGALENCIDHKTHTIFVKGGDGWSDTYNKTMSCFEFIKENIDFDCILRTNCCTYLNIKEINKFYVNILPNIVYTNEINSYFDKYTNKQCLSFSGALMLFGKELFNFFLSKKCIAQNTDDCVLSSFIREHYNNYITHLQQIQSSYIEDNNDISKVYAIKLKQFINNTIHSNVDVINNFGAIINSYSTIRKRYNHIGKYEHNSNPIRMKYKCLNDLLFADCRIKCQNGINNSAIITIQSNANSYIEEWVKYHLSLGIQKIYINDNNAIDGEKFGKVLKEYILNGQVVIINRRGEDISKIGEDTLYNECLNMFGNDYGTIYKLGNGEWIDSIDNNGIAKVKYKEYNKSLSEPKELPMMSEDNTKIFILGYKNFKCPVHNSKLYSIVDVKNDDAIRDGAIIDGVEYNYDIPIIYTSEKNSISDKNEIYDEWCGIYWLWKNYKWKDVEYIGLCQYRRYFEFLDEPAFDILSQTDTVVGGSAEQSANNGVMFQTYHNIDELTKLIQGFAQDDIPSARQFILNKTFYPSNLVLLSKEQFFDYCAFVFGYIKKYQVTQNLYTVDDIVNRIKSTIDKYRSKGSEERTIKYQKQLLAFLMERLGNIWIQKQILNKKKVMKVSCIETEHTGQNIFKYKDISNETDTKGTPDNGGDA